MDALTFEKHYPSHNNGILGCDGFSDTDTIFCLVANGDNNFLNFGIVNDTILFVDKSKEFKEDSINVYILKDNTFKLSRTRLAEIFQGRIVMTVNIHDD